MPKRRIAPDLRVASIDPGSPAERAGLAPGDEVLAVNGTPLRDVIDYLFEADDAVVRLDVRRDGITRHVAVVRAAGEPLGVRFHDRALDQVITCNNRCPFCFLGGLKPGMRRALYLKDDDYRLSFLHGNFITLSNLTQEDWARLEEQRLSPLYVSVHATEPELRHRLLGNERAPDILADLRRLGRAGIRAHTQIVILPGVNDGAHLDRSIQDLAGLYPTVQSVSVVPVGVTRFNAGRFDGALRPQTTAEARQLLEQIRPWQRQYRDRLGIDFVYASDEVYFRASRPFPPAWRYDGYCQYENGVGMSRWLIEDLRATVRRAQPHAAAPRIGLICGTMAAPLLERLASRLAAATGATITVHPVVNDFWGHTVWISGLLAGQDIARQVADQAPADIYFISPRTLDASGQALIDDWTPAQLEATLGAPLRVAQAFSEIYDLYFQSTPRREPHPCAASSAT